MDRLEFDLSVKDPIKTASEQADDKIKGVLGKLSKWRSVAVLGLLMLITMVLPLTTFSFVNPLSIEFLVNAVYSLIVATTCYYMFAPISARSERLESNTYREILENWLKLSDRVRKEGLMRAFYDFCIVRREEERAERKALFVEAAGIPKDIYEKEYAALSAKQLKALKRKGVFTKSQLKYLKCANGEIEILPINASMILSGLNVDNINDVGREKRRRWFALVRPLTLIVTVAIRGIIQASGNSDVGFMDYLSELVTTMSIILTWSFTGYRYGITLVRDEEQLMKGRSQFISMFLERMKVPCVDADNQKSPPERAGGTLQEIVDNVSEM